MQKAQQSALVQLTNQQLIQIRSSELAYFFNVCGVLGQQAAIISGQFTTVCNTKVLKPLFQASLTGHSLTSALRSIWRVNHIMCTLKTFFGWVVFMKFCFWVGSFSLNFHEVLFQFS